MLKMQIYMNLNNKTDVETVQTFLVNEIAKLSGLIKDRDVIITNNEDGTSSVVAKIRFPSDLLSDNLESAITSAWRKAPLNTMFAGGTKIVIHRCNHELSNAAPCSTVVKELIR